MAKESKAVPKVDAVTVIKDVVVEARRTCVHGVEVDAIRDSRARDLPLFKIVNEDTELLRLLSYAAEFLKDSNTLLSNRIGDALTDRKSCGEFWIVAVSEHQAKMAFIDRAYPMEKISKKDRDYRYLHLLESAAKDAAVTE